jgi:hypothetical protein
LLLLLLLLFVDGLLSLFLFLLCCLVIIVAFSYLFSLVAQERVDSVLFRFDPEDQIADKAKGGENANEYKIELTPEKVLCVTVNLSSHENYTYYSERKFDFLFDIRVLQAKRDCVPNLKATSLEFKKTIGKLIPMEIEFESWATHKNFRAVADGMDIASHLVCFRVFFFFFGFSFIL